MSFGLIGILCSSNRPKVGSTNKPTSCCFSQAFNFINLITHWVWWLWWVNRYRLENNIILCNVQFQWGYSMRGCNADWKWSELVDLLACAALSWPKFVLFTQWKGSWLRANFILVEKKNQFHRNRWTRNSRPPVLSN